MDQKIVKTFFISATSFAVGCVSTVFAVNWALGKRVKTEETSSEPSGINIGLSMVDPDHNMEVASQVLEQTILPSLLAAQQVGWSPEMFENNIKAQFDMMSTIMISLYQEAQTKEDMTLEEFKELIRSEIKFIVMSAKEQDNE